MSAALVLSFARNRRLTQNGTRDGVLRAVGGAAAPMCGSPGKQSRLNSARVCLFARAPGAELRLRSALFAPGHPTKSINSRNAVRLAALASTDLPGEHLANEAGRCLANFGRGVFLEKVRTLHRDHLLV